MEELFCQYWYFRRVAGMEFEHCEVIRTKLEKLRKSNVRRYKNDVSEFEGMMTRKL